MELLTAEQQLTTHSGMRQGSCFDAVINGLPRYLEQDRRLIDIENVAVFDLRVNSRSRCKFTKGDAKMTGVDANFPVG